MNQDESFLNLEDFILLNKIGEGAFGEVSIVIKKDNETKYVAKISKTSLTTRSTEFNLSLKREVNFLAQINHPYVVKFIGYSPIDFLQRNRPVIITEYLSNGSLYNVIKREKNNFTLESWTPTKKLINIFGIASIMSFLHKNEIIHRDLKLDNILLDEYLFPKIADFGLAKIIHTHKNYMIQQSKIGVKGTIIYTAPEIFKQTGKSLYSKKSDVYAFAFIVYEIMNPTFPYENKGIKEIINDIKNKKRPEIDSTVPKCYKKLIKKCWSHNPNHRPSFEWIIDKLKTEKEFITEEIDINEYNNYINLIENCSDNHVDLSNFTKIKISPNSYSFVNNNNNNNDLFNIIIEDTKKIIQRALLAKSNNDHMFVIYDDESIKLLATKAFNSTEFINIINYFTNVFVELKSNNKLLSPILEKLSVLFDTKSPMLKVNLLVSDFSHISDIIGEKSIPISIKIEESVKSIPSNAFSKCTSVYEIDIPTSVRKIEENAFYECESLENIIIPTSVNELGPSLFEKCHNVENVEIESNIKEIKENTFKECVTLKEIKLPRSIEKFHKESFEYCKSLKEIDKEILNNLEYIGEYAFHGCEYLNEFIISSKINNINEGVFSGCFRINEITIPKSIITIENDSFHLCTNLNKITFENPSSLITIKDRSFKNCTSLIELIIPTSVKIIGSNAFKNCYSLVKLNIPSSVNEIGESAFEGCKKLEKLDLEATITKISNKLFKGCKSLTEINIPETVTEIGIESFCLCLSLKNIKLPKKLTKIETRSFASCISLETLKIPHSIQQINPNAFDFCTSLKIESQELNQ